MGQPLCAPTPDSKLLICVGLDCSIFDPEYDDVPFQHAPSLNDYHYGGKMLLDPISNQNIVIGGTSELQSPYRGEFLHPDFGWLVHFGGAETFPLNYQRFSTAIGPDDTGIFFFSGFAVEESGNGTYFTNDVFNLNSANYTGYDEDQDGLITNPDQFPVLDLQLNELFEPKTFNSLGGNGFILHHRRQDCTNDTMR